jgi:hypothetical protein
MDFLEKLFHVSPDGGNGAYESLLLVLAGFLIFAVVFLGYFRARFAAKKNRDEKE